MIEVLIVFYFLGKYYVYMFVYINDIKLYVLFWNLLLLFNNIICKYIYVSKYRFFLFFN